MARIVREVRAGTVELCDDGVLHYVSRPDTRLDAELTIELFDTYRALAGDGPLLVLSDIRGVTASSAESRALATTAEATALHAGAAVIVGSRISRVIGNLFLRLNKPGYPTRLFNDAESARRWLHSIELHGVSAA